MSNNGPDLRNVLWYNQLGMHDVDRVGGKNASLGEMIQSFRFGRGRAKRFCHHRTGV